MPPGRANIEARPLVARGVGMPPKLCRFLAMLGVLCRTLEAARAPASDVLGVRVAIEDAEGAGARTGLVWPILEA